MTTERWTDDMLDRLVESINTLADVSERDAEGVNRLSNIAERHQQTLEMHQQNFNAVIGEIREIQAEVRGLQTENRRILDQLINRNGDSAFSISRIQRQRFASNGVI
jgi:ABC-type transporter Mla subunit MlaD